MGRKVKDTSDQEFDLEAAVEALIKGKGQGDANKAVELLLTENFQLRIDKRDLKKQLEDAGVPEGSVVMTAEDIKLFEALKALGKPEDLKKIIDEHPTLTEKLTDLTRAKIVGEAADAHGLKSSVLNDLVRINGLTIEMGQVEVEKNGQKTKVPSAFVKDDKGQSKPLIEVIDERFADYKPALKTTNGKSDDSVPWVPQSSSSESNPPPPSNLGKTYLEKVYGEPAKA